jgi:hypothetical protein
MFLITRLALHRASSYTSRTMESSGDAPFSKGAMVLVTLNTPREKFWGAVIDISPPGIAMRGIDLNSFEDFARLIKSGENATPASVFFPMHRVERIELDARNGDIPSLCERFENRTGQEFASLASFAAAETSAASSSSRKGD